MNSTSFCMFMFSSPLASMFFWSSIGFASFFPTSRSGSIMDSSDKTLLPNSGKLSVNQDVSNVDIYEWLWHYNKWSDFLSKNFIWIRISTWLVRDKTLREIIEKKLRGIVIKRTSFLTTSWRLQSQNLCKSGQIPQFLIPNSWVW